MGNISFAGCLLTSVRYAGKNRFERDVSNVFRRKSRKQRKHVFGGNRVQTGFTLHILQMSASVLHMKCCPFFALLKNF